eukprot:s595_g4.t1
MCQIFKYELALCGVSISKEDFCQFWGYVGCVDFGTSIFSLKPPLMPDADPLSPLKSCLLGCCRFWCFCHGPRHLFLSHEASDEHIERTVYRQSFGCDPRGAYCRLCERETWTYEIADRSLAVGRVGQLRGPSAICIDAVLETNLEFAEPSRAPVAVAEMEGEALEKALMNVETMSLTLELKSIPNSSLASSDGPLGRIKVGLAAALDRKIMPVCFMPEQVEEGCARVGPAKAANLEKALEDIHMTQLVLAIA